MEGPSDNRDTQTQWSYWIALGMVYGVGNVTYRQLLENFTSPQAVLHASTAALIETGVSSRVAQNITAFDQWADVLIHEASSFSVISPLANFSIIKTQTLSFAKSL